MLDLWWQHHSPETPMLRYADDLLILAETHEEAERKHNQLVKRTREIGMPLKHSVETATRDLTSSRTHWLGYGITRANSGIQATIADKSWDQLESHLHLAWENPSPQLSAIDTVLGWIEQQGAAYIHEDIPSVYEGIARRCQMEGFDEIPKSEVIAEQWYESYLRDWIQRREDFHSPNSCMAPSTGLADGYADRHRNLAANSGRGGVALLTDAPPQVAPLRREVYLYCDGSYLRSRNIGGWGYLVVDPESGAWYANSGFLDGTTNNRMELTAVIEGLSSFSENMHSHLVVDSEYVHKGITEWLANWENNGWRAGRRRTRPLKNKDLWQRLAALLERHYVDSQWVRGHSGHAENEYVDRLARQAAESRLQLISPATWV